MLGKTYPHRSKFCKNIKKISEEQADVINICHKYRNELYHSGLKYNDIVWDVSWYYHDIAVSLLENANPDHSWYSGAQVTKAVEKHAGEGGRKVLMEADQIADSLRADRPPRNRSLPEALSESACARVDETIEALEFLVTDDPQKRSEPQTVYELQFYDYVHSDDQLVKTIWDKVTSFKQREAALSFIKEIWEPIYSSNPLPMFIDHAKKIASVESESKALRAFEKFKGEFSYFARIVEEAAIALDGHIQSEIDRMRGK